jgi:hypothetical protein
MKRLIIAAGVLVVSSAHAAIVSHPSGCPGRSFCGCGVSVRVFGHPVRDLYLASNWGRFPSATAAPGMVAYRAHHVFYIEHANGDGTVTAYDPNSGGHQTRIHTVSLRGFHVVDPNGNRVRTAQMHRRHTREKALQTSQRGKGTAMAAYSKSWVGY